MLSKDGPVGGRSFHYLVLTNMEGSEDSLLENLSKLEFLTLVVSRLSLRREIDGIRKRKQCNRHRKVIEFKEVKLRLK